MLIHNLGMRSCSEPEADIERAVAIAVAPGGLRRAGSNEPGWEDREGQVRSGLSPGGSQISALE